MADNDRLAELRRRLLNQPASLVFAQLAEEYRRAGRYEDAIRVCRDGLSHHPAYLSARVTLGRALLAIGDVDPAEDELRSVLQAAPENLAALRGLAEIHQQRGHTADALSSYQAALALAPDDVDLRRTVASLESAAHLGPRPTHEAPGTPPHAPGSTHQVPPEAPGARHPAPVTPHAGPAEVPNDQPPAHLAHHALALAALERWLGAIRADRAARLGGDA